MVRRLQRGWDLPKPAGYTINGFTFHDGSSTLDRVGPLARTRELKAESWRLRELQDGLCNDKYGYSKQIWSSYYYVCGYSDSWWEEEGYYDWDLGKYVTTGVTFYEEEDYEYYMGREIYTLTGHGLPGYDGTHYTTATIKINGKTYTVTSDNRDDVVVTNLIPGVTMTIKQTGSVTLRINY